jgi:plasmid stability protein
MAILNIRNLPDDVHAALRIKAAKAGLSMEAEARRILQEACIEKKEPASPSDLQALVQSLYGEQRPVDVTGDLIRQRRAEAEKE